MVKAILLDGDGVVLKKRDKYTSQRLKEEYGIDMMPFIEGKYKDCEIGKADLKEELTKVIPSWGWEGTAEELLDYWFSYENVFDQEVLDIVVQARKKGIKCYLASDHTKYRADNLMKEVGLDKYFDRAFFSSHVGYTKEESEYWNKVLAELKKMNIGPDEIYFWDDKQNNVDMAKSKGVNATLFQEAKDIQILQPK